MAIDHDILRLQVPVNDLLAMERPQSFRDLVDDQADGRQIGTRIVAHPLTQGLAIAIFRHIIERAWRPPGSLELQNMRARHGSPDPFLASEHLDIYGIVHKIDRRRLQYDGVAGRLVLREVDLRTLGEMQLSQNPVAFEE